MTLCPTMKVETMLTNGTICYETPTTLVSLKHSFDYERILHYARVITDEGRPHICVRDKMVDTIYQLYYTRYSLHKHAYQHSVTLGVALMVRMPYMMASDSLEICGKSIVECLANMKAYTNFMMEYSTW
ncbi:SAMHD1 [Bugula neritina]|uniref:SAMHD1 n=1 Tax=Bugula neritina TaxID=10212 RepID=A0A7J7K9G3_BUGNE|nr:SAMHD1 [Bugula neritina]